QRIIFSTNNIVSQKSIGRCGITLRLDKFFLSINKKVLEVLKVICNGFHIIIVISIQSRYLRNNSLTLCKRVNYRGSFKVIGHTAVQAFGLLALPPWSKPIASLNCELKFRVPAKKTILVISI